MRERGGDTDLKYYIQYLTSTQNKFYVNTSLRTTNVALLLTYARHFQKLNCQTKKKNAYNSIFVR